ncbi:MAG: orotidine-5'-phosphate decarboxylase [Leptotrichiaceae bacterium]|nr:orotidine-5'-phosphate decarboxylase [Leptotrichiaceae bacterium]
MKYINDTAKEKLIIALDYNNFQEAEKLVENLGENISTYKVGLEIFLNTGGEIIDYLHSKNKRVFLDLKFHDITNTVKTACEYAIKKNVFMFNVHCSNGSLTMKEIRELSEKYSSKALLIGVTILTNLSEKDIREMFDSKMKLEDLVLNMAILAEKNGMNGIVCSPREAGDIKEKLGNDFLTVCPGVRPEFSLNSKDDQNRIMTPYQAIKNGADFLVVGRPVTKAENPEKAVKMILEEISEAL